MSDYTPEEPKTPFSESKPTGIISKYWPDWLPRSHGSFAILLLIFVLFGWATDTKGPNIPEVEPPPYSGTKDPGEPPEKPDESYYDESEDGKAEYSKDLKKYEEDKKEYPEKKKKYEEDQKARTELLESIAEENEKIKAQNKEADYSWTTIGLSGMTGKEFAKWRSDNGKFMANLVVVIWLTYCVFTMLLGPTLKAVPVHFGKDFGVVITPLVLLGILVALGAIIDDTVESNIGDQSIAGALQQFVMLIVNPITNGIKSLNTFVFDKWHIPIIFITITATFGLQRILGSKSKEE